MSPWIRVGLPKHIFDEDIASLIIDETCKFFNLTTKFMMSKTRKREAVNARQISMYLIRKNTRMSLKKTGLRFGGKDHSTVIYAVDTVNDLSETNIQYRESLEKIENNITEKINGI